jgi:integrase
MIIRKVLMAEREGSNRQPRPFTRAEVEAMHNAEDDRLLFLLLRWTGLRPSEAMGLTWGEVSFDRQQIEYVEHKSPRKRIRWIPTELLSALRAEHQRRNPQQNEPVLQNANGNV